MFCENGGAEEASSEEDGEYVRRRVLRMMGRCEGRGLELVPVLATCLLRH